MTAADILRMFAARGVRITLDGDNLKANAPVGALTDNDRNLLKCYKTELLWRLRHPEGDPPMSGYACSVFMDGERVKIPLDQLAAEGKEIAKREGLAPTLATLDLDLWAASVALGKYAEAHRQWIGQEAAA